MVHVPMFAQCPQTEVAAVFGRRLDAARELAAPVGAHATDDFDDLLARVDAVAFCVPPDIQAELAARAAAAGKPLLLEKPIALTLLQARGLASAIDAAGVPTQLMLTRRYSSRIRAFLDDLAGFEVLGLRGSFVSGAFLAGSPFRTPWRLEHGALLDVGPHILDLVDAAAGHIDAIEITGDPLGWVAITTHHDSGAIGQVCLSSVVPGELSDLHLFGPQGIRSAPQRPADERDEVMRTIPLEFAEVVRKWQPHHLDVHRGLYLQELMQG
jgi:predicted dehydrogenase